MSQNMATEEKIGVISGIILAIIFIILMFILIAFLLSRRRNLDKKYSSLPDKSQEDLLTPIWIPGKTSHEHVSSARQFEHDYHENGGVQGLSASSGYSHVPTHNTQDKCNDFNYRQKIPIIPDYLLDISLDSQSEDSCTNISHDNSVICGTLSRPTTRTTKTISDTSDSSHSSMALDKSMLREYQIESYISFQSDISNHVREATDHVYSTHVNIDSDKISSDPDDTIFSTEHPRLHETHFGDSLSDIPRTVIHSDIPRRVIPSDIPRTVIRSPLVQESLPAYRFPRTGNTIFDCELGCFISVEEFERKQKEINYH